MVPYPKIWLYRAKKDLNVPFLAWQPNVFLPATQVGFFTKKPKKTPTRAKPSPAPRPRRYTPITVRRPVKRTYLRPSAAWILQPVTEIALQDRSGAYGYVCAYDIIIDPFHASYGRIHYMILTPQTH